MKTRRGLDDIRRQRTIEPIHPQIGEPAEDQPDGASETRSEPLPTLHPQSAVSAPEIARAGHDEPMAAVPTRGVGELGPGMDRPQPSEVSRPRVRVTSTILVHTVCDFFSFITIALLPLLVTRLELTGEQKATLLGLGAVCSGAIQPLVAWVSDRFETRLPGILGLGLAVCCVSMIGYAPSFGVLVILHALGTAGIGAFHPPAAAAVGKLSGRKRAAGLAVFFLAGMVGGMSGNFLSAPMVGVLGSIGVAEPDPGLGLRRLVFLMPIGLAVVCWLAWAIARVPHAHASARDEHLTLTREERARRWFGVGVLYAGNVLRFGVNMALIYLFVRVAEDLAARQLGAGATPDELGLRGSVLNGPVQAAMQVGMGGMGLVFGLLLAPRFEKLAFFVMPMLGSIAIAAVPSVARLDHAYPLVLGMSVLTGIGFGSVIPVSLAVAQRLLPHRTSLASGLMLGGAWAFASLGPRLAEYVETRFSLDTAFHVTAGVLCLCGLVALALPGRTLLGSVRA